jgi:hypothetical protein
MKSLDWQLLAFILVAALTGLFWRIGQKLSAESDLLDAKYRREEIERFKAIKQLTRTWTEPQIDEAKKAGWDLEP